MFGQPDHLIGQQLQGPALAARGRARTGGGDQKRLILARQVALGIGARLFAQRRGHTAFHRTTLRQAHGRAPGTDAALDLGVTRSGIRRRKDLRPLQLARRILAAAQQHRQLASFVLGQLHTIAYVHPVLLRIGASR
jgi:hypothetical protein